jgi:hypothetical protein
VPLVLICDQSFAMGGGGTLSGSGEVLLPDRPPCGYERSVAEALERKRPSGGGPWAQPSASLAALLQGLVELGPAKVARWVSTFVAVREARSRPRLP